jgi:hypothetical protein
MIGVTVFGVLFTPIFFSVLMKLFAGKQKPATGPEHAIHEPELAGRDR